MANRTSAIPESKGRVQNELLKFKPAGPSVEQARQEMIAAKEPARTFRGGAKIPTFITENRGQGGNTPVEVVPQAAPVTVHAPAVAPEQREPARNTDVRDSRTVTALRFRAQQKLSQAGYRHGASVDLVEAVNEGVVTKEEAEALWGRPLEIEEAVNEPVVEAAVPAGVPPAPPAPERVPANETEVDEIDEENFTARIFRDGKIWVAQITYKNGAGTERFTANNKNDLVKVLIKAKGHATTKIRQVSEDYKKRLRENLFAKPDDANFFYSLLKEMYNMTPEQFKALPEESREALQDNLQAVEAAKFVQSYPDYYGSDTNFKLIGDFLNKEGWPLTSHNLEIAYLRLKAQDVLDEKPAEQVDAPAAPAVTATSVVAPEVPAQPVATHVEDSTVASVPVENPSVPAVTPAAPAPRKRGGPSGLIPGSSSVSPTETPRRTEDRSRSREVSSEELKAAKEAADRGDFTALKRIATQDRKYGRY